MSNDLTEALDRIEALAAAVTNGATLDRYDHGGGRLARFEGPTRRLVADFYHEGDREFYAAARTDLPRLVAVVRAVLGMHRPVQINVVDDPICVAEECDHDGECPETGVLTICAGCDEMCEEAYAYYAETHISITAWPCETVWAAMKAWEEGR